MKYRENIERMDREVSEFIDTFEDLKSLPMMKNESELKNMVLGMKMCFGLYHDKFQRMEFGMNWNEEDE